MSQFFALLDVPKCKTGEKRRYCTIAGCQVSYQRDVSSSTLKKHAMTHSSQPSLIDVLAVHNDVSLPEAAAKTFALLNWALRHSEQVSNAKCLLVEHSFYLFFVYIYI